MLVPEASLNLDRCATPWKSKIGPARQIFPMQPKAIAFSAPHSSPPIANAWCGRDRSVQGSCPGPCRSCPRSRAGSPGSRRADARRASYRNEVRRFVIAIYVERPAQLRPLRSTLPASLNDGDEAQSGQSNGLARPSTPDQIVEQPAKPNLRYHPLPQHNAPKTPCIPTQENVPTHPNANRHPPPATPAHPTAHRT